MMMSKTGWGASVAGLLLVPALAAAVNFVEQPSPFELNTWSNVTMTQTQYGELTGWPHTF